MKENQNAFVTVAVLFVLAILICLALLIYQASQDLVQMYVEEQHAAISRLEGSKQAFESLQPFESPPEISTSCQTFLVKVGKFETERRICVLQGDKEILLSNIRLDLSSYAAPPVFDIRAEQIIPCTDSIDEAPKFTTLYGTGLTPAAYKGNETCQSAAGEFLAGQYLNSNLAIAGDAVLIGKLLVFGYCEVKGKVNLAENLLLICAGDIIINQIEAASQKSLTLLSLTGSVLLNSLAPAANLRVIAAKGIFMPSHENTGTNEVYPAVRELIVTGLQ